MLQKEGGLSYSSIAGLSTTSLSPLIKMKGIVRYTFLTLASSKVLLRTLQNWVHCNYIQKHTSR